MSPSRESQHYVINPANLCGALDDGIEDRLHVRRRAADDAEHLGRRRLMLQRLAQFRIALAEFLEQPHVFDGDDGLIGEGFEKCDLFFGERTNFGPADHDRADGNTFTQQRHSEQSSDAQPLMDALHVRTILFALGHHVVNVHDPAFENGTAGRGPRVIGSASPTGRSTGISSVVSRHPHAIRLQRDRI